jgi:hypothetical protein
VWLVGGGGQHSFTLLQGVRPGLGGRAYTPSQVTPPVMRHQRPQGGRTYFLRQGAGRQQVLCDPWLVGSLTFGGLPWLYEGKKDTSGLGMAAADGTDILLLSQACNGLRTRCMAQCDSDASTYMHSACVRHRG